MLNLHVCGLSVWPKNIFIFPKVTKAKSWCARYGWCMKFTPTQLQQYREQGYVAMPGFFDDREVKAMQLELAELQRDGLLRNVATDGDGKTTSQTIQNLQVCPLSPKSEFFRSLPFCPKVIAAIQQCLGDPIQQQLDQIFLKPAGHGAGTSWHQDNAYFSIPDPIQGVGMWVAMHDASVANGTMHMIPGIYREKLTHTRDGGSDHHVRCYPNEDKAMPVEMKAGGALFFNYGVPHCTKANTTNKPRAGLALHFVRAGVADRPNHKLPGPILTGPNACDGKTAWGLPVTGTWEQQVARKLATT